MMYRFFCALCVALYPELASPQTPTSNVEACVNEAKQKHEDSKIDNYTSYKCEGPTALRLTTRPDECATGVKLPLNRIHSISRNLEDGLYVRSSWDESTCGGTCEIRYYENKDPSYFCEVRKYSSPRLSANDDRPARNRKDEPRSDELRQRRPSIAARLSTRNRSYRTYLPQWRWCDSEDPWCCSEYPW